MSVQNKGKVQKVLLSGFAVSAGLLSGAIVMLLLGKNPAEAYHNLLQGSGLLPKYSYAGYKNMFTDFMSFLNAWTPMIFAALSVAAALKAGLFNIGVSGQMLASGFAATMAVGYLSLAPGVAKPLVVLIGAATGALTGGLIGWLKYRFRINEVVSCIMLNYIIQYICSFFIHMYCLDPISRQSNPVSKAARLTLTEQMVGGGKTDIPLGILLAAVSVFLLWFIQEKTSRGFEIKTVGLNKTAAWYAGMSVGKITVTAMMISGALAGLAGVSYYLGYYGSIQPRVLAETGFDAIAVALLGAGSPVGIVFSSFLITVISKGSTYMNSISGVEPELASVITGIILLFAACEGYIGGRMRTRQGNRSRQRAENEQV